MKIFIWKNPQTIFLWFHLWLTICLEIPLFIRVYIIITDVTLVMGKERSKHTMDIASLGLNSFEESPPNCGLMGLGNGGIQAPKRFSSQMTHIPTKLFSFQPFDPLSQYFFHRQNPREWPWSTGGNSSSDPRLKKKGKKVPNGLI